MVATRMYFGTGSAAPVTPIAQGPWDVTAGRDLKALHQHKLTTATTAIVSNAQANSFTQTWASGQSALLYLAVSGPMIGHQTISGTLKAYRLCGASLGAKAVTRMEAYVVSRDGQTVRGTLLPLGDYGTDTQLRDNGGVRNAAFAVAGTAVTEVKCKPGDRVVIGMGFSDAAGATPGAFTQYGDATTNASGDVGENETQTGGIGWVEFSATLSFYEVTFTDVGQTSGSGTSLTTNFTHLPTTGTVQLAFVGMFAGATKTTVPTLSGCGLVWENLHTELGTTSTPGNARMTVFATLADGAQIDDALTADFGGNTIQSAIIGWIEIGGILPSGILLGPDGAIFQAGGAHNTVNAPTPLTYNIFTANNDPDNALIYCELSEIQTTVLRAISGWDGRGIHSTIGFIPFVRTNAALSATIDFAGGGGDAFTVVMVELNFAGLLALARKSFAQDWSSPRGGCCPCA